jgi:hypothetical protein
VLLLIDASLELLCPARLPHAANVCRSGGDSPCAPGRRGAPVAPSGLFLIREVPDALMLSCCIDYLRLVVHYVHRCPSPSAAIVTQLVTRLFAPHREGPLATVRHHPHYGRHEARMRRGALPNLAVLLDQERHIRRRWRARRRALR